MSTEMPDEEIRRLAIGRVRLKKCLFSFNCISLLVSL